MHNKASFMQKNFRNSQSFIVLWCPVWYYPTVFVFAWINKTVDSYRFVENFACAAPCITLMRSLIETDISNCAWMLTFSNPVTSTIIAVFTIVIF